MTKEVFYCVYINFLFEGGLITVLFMVCEDKPWPRLLRKHLIGSVPIV